MDEGLARAKRELLAPARLPKDAETQRGVDDLVCVPPPDGELPALAAALTQARASGTAPK